MVLRNGNDCNLLNERMLPMTFPLNSPLGTNLKGQEKFAW